MPAAVVAAGITAAGAIGAAAISSGKGSNSTSGQSVSDTTHTPWGPQGNAIEAGLSEAQTVYDNRTAQGPYTGDLYANQNDTQKTAEGYAAGQAQGPGATAANTAYGMGGQASGNIGAASDSAAEIANGGIGSSNGALTDALTRYGSGQTSVVNAPLQDTLHASATAGAKQIGGFNAGLSGIMQNAQADPTAQLAADAGTYADNPGLKAQLANIHGQIGDTLNEQTVPGLNRAAAMGGNLNSSRAGMAEAMANRDAALAEGNADAQVLNNAWNTGLTTAAGQRTAGLNTATSAANAGLVGNSNLALGTGNQDISASNSAITAANAGLAQETTHQIGDANAKLGADQNLLTGANTALNANTTGSSLVNNNSTLMATAGQLQQNDAQQQDNAAYTAWKQKNEYQQGLLNDYMSNVTKPSGYYDSATSTASNQTPPSSVGTLLAGTGTAVGSQFLPGGIFNKVNKDGTPNKSYIGDIFNSSNADNNGFDTTPMQIPADAPASFADGGG